MSEPLAAGPVPGSDDCNLAMLAHLLGIVSSFLGALLIWLLKKDQSSFVDDQGKEALNFQITMLLAYMVAGFLTFVLIGLLLMPLLVAANFVLCVLAAVAASKGRRYRYPLAIRLLR